MTAEPMARSSASPIIFRHRRRIQPRQRYWQIVAKRAVLASGAIERPIVFGGNDRPGVMLAGAVRTYVNRFGVVPGRNAVVVTTGDDGWRTAARSCVLPAATLRRSSIRGATSIRPAGGGRQSRHAHHSRCAGAGRRMAALSVSGLDVLHESGTDRAPALRSCRDVERLESDDPSDHPSRRQGRSGMSACVHLSRRDNCRRVCRSRAPLAASYGLARAIERGRHRRERQRQPIAGSTQSRCRR